MDTITTKRREEILEEMRHISRMRQGGLSQQHYKVGHGRSARRQGPYHILQGWRGGQHWSTRVSKEDAAQISEDVKAYARFQALCREFIEITEQATLKEETIDSKKNDRRLRKTVFWKQMRS